EQVFDALCVGRFAGADLAGREVCLAQDSLWGHLPDLVLGHRGVDREVRVGLNRAGDVGGITVEPMQDRTAHVGGLEVFDDLGCDAAAVDGDEYRFAADDAQYILKDRTLASQVAA